MSADMVCCDKMAKGVKKTRYNCQFVKRKAFGKINRIEYGCLISKQSHEVIIVLGSGCRCYM